MLESKSEKLKVPKDVELTLLKNKMSKNKTKTLKKELRELENKKNDEKREMNKKTMENNPWLRLPWNTIWAYISFLSKPWILAYITYLKSPFWSNVDTWTEEVFLWKIFIINKAVVSFLQPKKNLLINHPPVWDESWIVKCIIGQSKIERMKKNETLGWKPERAV